MVDSCRSVLVVRQNHATEKAAGLIRFGCKRLPVTNRHNGFSYHFNGVFAAAPAIARSAVVAAEVAAVAGQSGIHLTAAGAQENYRLQQNLEQLQRQQQTYQLQLEQQQNQLR